MKQLSLGELQTGMVVAEDIRDQSGPLLFKSGIEINDRVKRILKQWGVAVVSVEIEIDPEASKTQKPEQKRAQTVESKSSPATHKAPAGGATNASQMIESLQGAGEVFNRDFIVEIQEREKLLRKVFRFNDMKHPFIEQLFRQVLYRFIQQQGNQ